MIKEYHRLDFNIVPFVRQDENAPCLVKWSEYKDKLYDGEFPENCNYAAICGYHNKVCLDFESQLNHNAMLDYKYVDAVLSGLKTRIDRSPHGFHVWVEADKLPKNSSWVNGVCKIEIKSVGTVVHMPPSVRYGFEYYNLNENPHPCKVNMLEVLQRIQKLGYSGNLNGESRTYHFDRKLKRGERDEQIFRTLGAIRRVEPKIDEVVLLQIARYINDCAEEQLEDQQLQDKVKSVMKYEVTPKKRISAW